MRVYFTVSAADGDGSATGAGVTAGAGASGVVTGAAAAAGAAAFTVVSAQAEHAGTAPQPTGSTQCCIAQTVLGHRTRWTFTRQVLGQHDFVRALASLLLKTKTSEQTTTPNRSFLNIS